MVMKLVWSVLNLYDCLPNVDEGTNIYIKFPQLFKGYDKFHRKEKTNNDQTHPSGKYLQQRLLPLWV